MTVFAAFLAIATTSTPMASLIWSRNLYAAYPAATSAAAMAPMGLANIAAVSALTAPTAPTPMAVVNVAMLDIIAGPKNAAAAAPATAKTSADVINASISAPT